MCDTQKIKFRALQTIGIKLLFILLLSTSFSYAQTLQQAIKVGFFSTNQYLEDREKLLEDYTLYKEQSSQGTKLYIINEKSSIKNLLKEVKTLVPDAFITTIKTLSQKKYKIQLLKVIRVGKLSTNQKFLEKNLIHKQETPSGTRLYIVPDDSQNIKEFLKKVRKVDPNAYITLAPIKIEVDKEPLPIKKSIQKKEIQVPIKTTSPKKVSPPTWEYLIDISDIQFKKAIRLYEQKEYQDAYKIFSYLLKTSTKVDANLLNFYLGKSAYMLKKYIEALIAFSRVVINDPSNLHVKLEIAKTYVKMGLIEEAKSEFYYLQKQDISTEIQQEINLILEKIDKKEQKNFVYGLVMAGIKYDSNINNESDKVSYKIYDPDDGSYLDILNETKEPAVMYDIGAIVRHLYKGDYGFRLKDTLTVYSLMYPEFKSHDIQLLSLDISPSYTFDNNKIALSFYADNIWYGRENYLTTFSLIPQFKRQLHEDLLFNSSLEYSYIKFAQTKDKDKESRFYEFTNSLDIQTDNLGIFTPKILLGKEERIRGTRSDIANEYYSIGLRNTYKINKYFRLKSRANLLFRDYSYNDINFQNKRKDQKHTLSLSLSYQYLKNMVFDIGMRYINQNSNQEPYDYDDYLIKSSIFYNY